MVKVALIVLPYPYLITSDIKIDFEAIMSLVKKLNQILQFGLRPTFTSTGDDGIKVVEDSYLRSELKPYLRHYHDVSSTYDVTSIFRENTQNFERPFSAEKLANVFAYGNILEFLFDDIQVDELAGRMGDLDFLVKQLFSSSVSRKVYEMYVGKNMLAPRAGNEFFIPPILTVYVAVLIAENMEEFQESVKAFQEGRCPLNLLIADSIAVGSNKATNFIHAPFFNVCINPILINLQKRGDYKLQDAFGSIFYLMAAIGELYNILALVGDAHELCAITRSTIPTELYEKVGMLKINPVTDLKNLYGLRDFRRYEKIFRLGMTEDINYFRSYGTKASKIIWKKEALPHFAGIIEALSLIDAYLVHLPDKTVFKAAQNATGFGSNIYKRFESDFKDFMETVEELVKDITQVIEGARTTVQLNLAIVTLFWTLVFTIVLSEDVRSWLLSLISSFRNLKSPLPHPWC